MVSAFHRISSGLAESISPFYNNHNMPTLDELESRLQSLLEVQLIKYLPGYNAEDRLFQHLAAAMHNNLKEVEGATFAPNVYVIIANPSTLSRWQTQQRLVKVLAEALLTTGEEAGFHFLTNPTVTTAADTEMTANETHIIASYTGESIGETQGMPIEFQLDTPADAIPPDAFLILGGTKIITLNHPVINIGRRLDNQVVINDPRVSRTHAQLRVAKGHFVIFDLCSTGGTFVNGQRINQSILYPGDVISLAGVTLIFSQDLPTRHDRENVKTEPRSAISADRPTVVTLETVNKVNKKGKKTKKK
jgi:pSer/pThr/pTyr-binding forkhead associated (FHA) protein